MQRIQDEWIAIGRSTAPATRPLAEDGVARLFRQAGLDPPKAFAWLGSPFAGYLVSCVLCVMDYGRPFTGLRAELDELLGPRVATRELLHPREDERLEEVSEQIAYGVLHPLHNAVHDSVWAGSLYGDPVKPSLWDQAGASVWARLGEQVGDHLVNYDEDAWRQLGESLWNDLVRPGGEPADKEWWREIRAKVGQHAGGRGQHAAGHVAVAAWLRELGYGASDLEIALMEVARSCGWWWPYQRLVILTERPRLLLLEDPPRGRGRSSTKASRLHCPDGPAVLYPDGFGVFSWHGVVVPAEVITQPVDIDTIEAVTDSQVRDVLIDRYGRERYREELAQRRRGAHVEVDELLFASIGEHSNEYVLVVSSDPDKAAACLRRAGARFMNVSSSGLELTGSTLPAEPDSDDPDVETPNYVSDVRFAERGPWIYIDCKGRIPDPMKDAFIRILREEIDRSGIQHARLEPPSPESVHRSA